MAEQTFRPRLRHVDLFPLPKEVGQSFFGLRDPLQLSPHVLSISLDVVYLLRFFDGSRSLDEVRLEYQRQLGRDFPNDQLDQVVQMLDKHYFLHGDAFERYFADLVKSFRQSEIRDAFHAGVAYTKDAVSLNEFLGGFFSAPEGPGYPSGARSGESIPAIIVPHIDLRLGGPSYAWGYRALGEAEKPDLVVVLGTGHHGLKNLFALTRKRFASPLGELQVDESFVNRLASLCPYDLFVDEFSHRTEHTIEFQLLFLQLLFGSGVKLVPILCSFSYPMVTSAPTGELIQQFTEALGETIRRDGRRICLVASADLAHVGPRYGDPEGFPGTKLQEIKEADLEMLRYVERVDAEGFVRYVAQEKDRRRICGLSPIYTMLKVLQGGSGTVVSHGHGEMDQLGSACSYASVVFRS